LSLSCPPAARVSRQFERYTGGALSALALNGAAYTSGAVYQKDGGAVSCAPALVSLSCPCESLIRAARPCPCPCIVHQGAPLSVPMMSTRAPRPCDRYQGAALGPVTPPPFCPYTAPLSAVLVTATRARRRVPGSVQGAAVSLSLSLSHIVQGAPCRAALVIISRRPGSIGRPGELGISYLVRFYSVTPVTPRRVVSDTAAVRSLITLWIRA
jgi:hypothetical protein